MRFFRRRKRARRINADDGLRTKRTGVLRKNASFFRRGDCQRSGKHYNLQIQANYRNAALERAERVFRQDAPEARLNDEPQEQESRGICLTKTT